MADLSPKEIEVHATNTTVRVVLVNTDYNHNLPSAPADREYLASNIAALMNKNAEKDPGLKPILVLHVEFVRHGVWSKTIRRYRVPQTSGREIRAPSDRIWAAMRSA